MCLRICSGEKVQAKSPFYFFYFMGWLVYAHSLLTKMSTSNVNIFLFSPFRHIANNVTARRRIQNKNMEYGTLGITSPYMSIPESTPTHLSWVTLCQSRP